MSAVTMSALNRLLRLRELLAQLEMLDAAVGQVQARALALEATLTQDDAGAAALESLCLQRIAAAQQSLALLRGQGYGTATLEAEVATLARFLPAPPRLAVDIGGNVGDYTAVLQARWPGLPVHVFEPASVNVRHLRERFAGTPAVRIHAHALSDRDGEATLFADVPGSGMGSLTQRDLRDRGIAFDATETVRVRRFEDVWREALGGAPIDLLKIDIEGHELAALRGFGAALATVRVLQFEFGGCNLDTRTQWRDFHALLTGAGFALHRITPLGPEPLPQWLEIDEYYSTTNFVAVNGRAPN